MLSFQKQFGAQVGKASPQNIANVVWSFAQMRYSPYESVMESLFETVAQKVDTFSEQDVATLLWGCGKLRYVCIATLFVTHTHTHTLLSLSPQIRSEK